MNLKALKDSLNRWCPMSMLVLAAAFPSIGRADNRVAIIVNGNDILGGLQYRFNRDEENVAKLYGNQYKTIRIHAADGMDASSFRKAIADLPKTDELSLTFLTHGALRNAGDSFNYVKPLTGEQLKRFPVGHLRPDELATQIGDPEHPLTDSVRFGFAMQKNTNPDWNSDFIGLGDLHDALAEFKHSNPNAKININVLSCFGGNVIRALKDIPDIQVFTGGSASQSSDVIASKSEALKSAKEDSQKGYNERYFDPNKCTSVECMKQDEQTEFISFYINHLANGESYLDAYDHGKDEYLNSKINVMDSFRSMSLYGDVSHDYSVRPQSSLELTFSDQCLGTAVRTEVVPFCEKPQNQISPITADSMKSMLFNYLQEQIKSDNQYLGKVKTLFDCDKTQQEHEAEILRKAYGDALAVLKKKYEAIQQSNIDAAIADAKEKLAALDRAKTNQELVPFIEDTLENSTLLEGLKDDSPGMLKLNKLLAADPFKQYITEYSVPGALDAYKAKVNEHFSRKEIDNCLALPMECDLSKVLSTSYLNERSLIRPVESSKVEEKAQVLILEKCSSDIVAKASAVSIATARAQQLQCIMNHTQGDPLLRAYALQSVVFTMSKEARDKACQLYSDEEAKNKRLEGCLVQPASVAGDEFWERMITLYMQGQASVNARAR